MTKTQETTLEATQADPLVIWTLHQQTQAKCG